MHLVHASLKAASGGSGTESDAHLLQDLLWAHAFPGHGLEHLRVRAAAHGADLVLFIRAETEAIAAARAHSLLSNALTPLGALGYRVVSLP
ncbi:hypothetical protein [Streptomyces sp. NPDC051567]|uniref:hypothetical protein n=1 Tax=Streptomyces sp. NPDC051567 TaxID=3365660 RepID=UPI0037B7EF79